MTIKKKPETKKKVVSKKPNKISDKLIEKMIGKDRNKLLGYEKLESKGKDFNKSIDDIVAKMKKSGKMDKNDMDVVKVLADIAKKTKERNAYIIVKVMDKNIAFSHLGFGRDIKPNEYAQILDALSRQALSVIIDKM